VIKNLTVFTINQKMINKQNVHSIIANLKLDLNFRLNSLFINFIDKEQITQLNRTYLNHDYSTDILTFNYSGDQKNLDGEIFISLDDAEENSKYFGVPLSLELKRLIIHGILHLLGYDDKAEKKKKIMDEKENYFVNKLKSLKI
jgi:probable rRNA maturation factor